MAKNASADIGGKALNLAVLRSIPGITVPPFTVLPASLSLRESETTIQTFLGMHPSMQEVAVRSSAVSEDSAQASFAGMYATRLRVPANAAAIIAAVQDVRSHSLGKEHVAAHYTAQRGVQSSDTGIAVIIQSMVNADFSGVMLSHSLHARDGYYLVSTTQGLGEAVASGSTNGRLVRIARAIDTSVLRERWLAELTDAMRKLEKHFRSSSLDVEFAFANGTLHILQCRPLTTTSTVGVAPENEVDLLNRLSELNEYVVSNFDGDVLGDMIDINPAELLGCSPSRLDISIFRHLFADNVVEKVRREMGYDPLDIGLIREVGGKPYVSLRASAYSFRPAGVPEDVYEKIFAVYREQLVANPGLQDRVEFAVFAMRYGEKLEKIMERAGLTMNEKAAVRAAYRKLDSSITAVSDDCKSSLAEWFAGYKERTHRIANGPFSEMLEHVAIGTGQFVRAARLAFYWKNKFEELHPEENLNELLAGHIQSVSSRMQADMVLCREGHLTKKELVARYGHLRPGQFSVFGESYAGDPQHYLFNQLQDARALHVEKRTHQFETTAEFRNVVAFMQAREETKFLFSRSLGIFIDSLKAALDDNGVHYAVASGCDWKELGLVLGEGTQPSAAREQSTPMILPDVILPGHADLRVVTFSKAAPSYITRSVVKARLCVLHNPSMHEDVTGAIVLIPNADPGYDFLFHSGAVGIITKTGGPASHMCIRAVELQVPSCIGCGERTYDALSTVHTAILDCHAGQIVIPE